MFDVESELSYANEKKLMQQPVAGPGREDVGDASPLPLANFNNVFDE